MSYLDVHNRAQRVIEEYNKGNNPALDGYVDAFIASLAYAMAKDTIARGNATDSDIYREYDNLNGSIFQFMMLSHGIPMSVVIGSDVSGRDWFVSCFHTYINQWIEGEIL